MVNLHSHKVWEYTGNLELRIQRVLRHFLYGYKGGSFGLNRILNHASKSSRVVTAVACVTNPAPNQSHSGGGNAMCSCRSNNCATCSQGWDQPSPNPTMQSIIMCQVETQLKVICGQARHSPQTHSGEKDSPSRQCHQPVLIFILRWLLLSWPGWPQSHNPPASASWPSEITGICHHASVNFLYAESIFVNSDAVAV